MRCRSLLALVVMTMGLCLAPARAGGHAAPGARGRVVAGSPIIVMLDTGVRATHQEFDYRGPAAKTGQLVAWWDFTGDRKDRVVEPKPGQLWDPQVPVPYDPVGHGTGVAAMAVGLNRDPLKTPSAAPGFRFGVARVLATTSGAQAPLADAIRWAVHSVHASVINISIGSIVSAPALIVADDYTALDEARAAGVLVVVGNGNGWGNVGCAPGEPGWATWYTSSTSVLAVGAAGPISACLTTDPEVTTNYSPWTATISSDHAYGYEGGTSFASPFVAGFAARLIAEARQAHQATDPARIQRLIEYVAVDTTLPPQLEGYGEVELAQFSLALRHARAGTFPARPSPDPTKSYVDEIAVLRDFWSNKLRNT